MANKLCGDLCLQEDKPMYHKALKHFEIAASRNVFSAHFSAFDIKIKLSLGPDIETFYANMLQEFTENNYQMLTFVHATEFYLFIRRDLCAAVNYFMKAIALDQNFHALTDRWVKYIQKNVNLYEVISNEVRYSIDSQMYHDSNQLNLLKNALKKISEINPKLLGVPVVPNKVQGYLDTYERESKNVSGRGRGRGRGRGYGRGTGRGGRGRGRGGESHSERTFGYDNQNRGSGRTNSGDRRGFVPRNRSTSRNRTGQNTNESQSKFDQSQFNRLSYAHDKSEENLENPYYIKFLELKYKKMTKSESFKEWLQEYGEAPSNVVKSNKASKSKKGRNDKNSDAKFQEPGNSDAKFQELRNSDAKFQELISVVNQLKEEINEIKLSETRSCCSSAQYRRRQCHSLKSLEYKELDEYRKPEEYYRRKHRGDYLSPDRYRDPRDRYYRSHRLEDRNRWRSEDRNARYNRIPSHKEKDKYDRRINYKSYDDSDSNSDSESRYHSSHDHQSERRSRKSSFLDRRRDYNASRHSSPTYSDRKYLASSHRHRSDDRRVRNEYLQRFHNSNSNSSESDSQSYPSQREEKPRRRGSIESEYPRYRRNSVSETEKGSKHSKHWKTENQQIGGRLNEGKLKKDGKFVKKEVSSHSSSKSSTDEDRDIRKGGNDQDSDREPCLGYGKVKHHNIKKDDSIHRSYKEQYGSSSSSSESVPDEKSVSKKSYPKSKGKVRKDVEYERCHDESSERSYRNKNREVYSEHRSDKYSSSGIHKYQNDGSKESKKYDERSEMLSKVDSKKNVSRPSNVDKISHFKEQRSDEALKMSRKSRDSDKPVKEYTRDEARRMERKNHDLEKSENYSHKSSKLKDSAYSQFDTSTKQPSSSRKGTSVSRSSSEWENITHQETLIARPETNRSDRENRCSRSISGDEYEKTSSG
ncbi:uncharacterized protein DDB_G0283697-like [Halyomorpha halys]